MENKEKEPKSIGTDVTTDKEINELMLKHVFEGSADAVLPRHDFCNRLTNTFMALAFMDYRVSIHDDFPDNPVEETFYLSRHGDYFEATVRHNANGPIQAIYNKKPGRALCLAMLYRKGVQLPDHPDYLWTPEEEFEGG